VTDIASATSELLDLEAWDRLEAVETQRMELVDGVVMMTPRPQIPHAIAMGRVYRKVDDAAQIGSLALIEPEVAITEDQIPTVRVPDLLLTQPGVATRKERIGGRDTLLAIELVSPGSRRTDYVAKRFEYEEAQIPYYWIIDIDERRITCLKLVGGQYQEVTVPAGDRVVIPEPIRVEFGWDELVR
jgi:Uma2 family endonuclease